MMPSFDRVVITWIVEILPREESQLVFTNRSMIDDCSHCSYIKKVRMSEILELCTFFSI